MENFFKIDSLPRKLQISMEGADDAAETIENGKNSCKRHRSSENEPEDRLSSLPDSILVHILSFLPMEDAVKTVLLQRFGNLWTSVHTLEFDGRSNNNFSNAHDSKWFMNFVYHALQFHDCPKIFKFSLMFGCYLYFLPKTVGRHNRKPLKQEFSDDIDAWICFAVLKKVEVLDLSILAHESSSSRFDYDLPNSVLTCDSLVELKLVNIGFGEPRHVHMKSLKILSLTTLFLGDIMIEGILSGCPSLESLSLIKCYGMSKINCTSSHLKILTVDIGDFYEALEISGPNLTSLHISGDLWPVDVRNLSSLVEATLDLFSKCRVDKGYSNIGILLENLHHVNIFTISNWCVLLLSFWEFTNVPCPSSSRKHIVLKTMLRKEHLPGIISLLRSSPHLEILSIYIEAETTANELQLGLPGSYEENFWDNNSWFRSHAFNEDEYLDLQPPFSCLRNHLKIVKIFVCISSPYLLKLLKFLLRFSNVLEEMVISFKWDGKSNQPSQSFSKEVLKFSETLLRFPKASDRAVILFS